MMSMRKATAFEVLHDPRKNKGTAFTKAERVKYGLTGLLPDQVETMDTQILRVNGQLAGLDLPIEKYVYLTALLDRNETLFFKTVISDPERFLPLVYTPTVGEACQRLGHIARRPRGLFISIKNRERIATLLRNWPVRDIRFIVVTDGQRILGLGDLGVGGIGISIGKLALYTSCAGVPPEHTLPVVLDVGTDNEQLLKDPLYPGLKQPRVRGRAYDAFVEAFVKAVMKVYPGACIQWEDFAGANAIRILDRYRDRLCTFNDDVQGTAAVAVAGFIAVSRLLGRPFADQRFLFLGAGAAAFGIADLLMKKLQKDGLGREEALRRIRMFDVNGLLVTSRTDLAEYQRPFADNGPPSNDFAECVLRLRPTAIVGVSTVGGAFTRQVIENMSAINERPVIFPYSNPTSHSECTAEQAYTWSDGRAIFASGSPFAPVIYKGRAFTPGQGNNVFIFPALGMAVFATRAKRVTDDMLITAAEAVAEQVTERDFGAGLIYPAVRIIREVSVNVAVRIAEAIFESGRAGVRRPKDIRAFIERQMYQPVYR
jgi:malate dehydrogenase (oxaloacetate-decarboxylating)(NADP+)